MVQAIPVIEVEGCCIDIKSLEQNLALQLLIEVLKTQNCESKITYLDGEKGILRYRGYDVDDLAKKASF